MVIKMNQSYWQATTKHTKEKILDKDLSVDIAIIGGGMAGVSIAYALKESKMSIAVLEKDELGSHTSGHTTAKVTTLHGLHYLKLKENYDIHQAYLYYKSNDEALKEIKEIIDKEHIDCDWQDNTAYIYTNDASFQKDIQSQQDIFQSLRVPFVKDKQYLESMGLEKQGIFHPLKYLYGLRQACQDVQFYEHSQVVHIERKNGMFELEVNGHHVKCHYLVHATRYPFIRKGIYFMKLFQQREFINYCQDKNVDYSSLCVDITQSERPLQNGHLHIDHDAKDWFTQDSIALRGVPYIGRIDKYSQEFIVYGFQKWGMTLSRVAGQLISDLILDKENPYEDLYACHYFSMSSASQYFQKLINHIKRGYWSNHFDTVEKDQIACNEGGLVREGGKLYAMYRDEKGNDHYFSPYCPHMKCLVQFNSKTKTWDCPCHQSIYNAYGEVIEGPTLYPLKKK